MESEQKPSIGRIVLYAPADTDPEHNNAEVLPAIIVRVWNETCVNLKVLNDGGEDFWRTSVTQGDAPFHWNWPKRV